jgi:hypothetical protein
MPAVVDSNVLREAGSFWTIQKECLEWMATHSSGIPALRRPGQKFASASGRIFGR